MPSDELHSATSGDAFPSSSIDNSDHSVDAAPRRPRLTPAIADVRRAVRAALTGADELTTGAGATRQTTTTAASDDLVLVALSGGADSLALAAATAFEAPRAGRRAGVVIIDHGLQPGSPDVAATAARQASELGLDPVIVTRVTVADGPAAHTGGTEAAAREARYAALARAARETRASAVLLGHTLDDQAETVLLGLARGSGATSLAGMPRVALSDGTQYVRPLLGIARETTHAFCADSRLRPWNDPHNRDSSFARVRVRETVLPVLERELGPGVAEALARTAELLAEDSAALDAMVEEFAEDVCEHSEAGISISIAALEANPAALRNRLIRYVALSEFGVSISRTHTLAIAALVTDWRGQKPLNLPAFTASRQGAYLTLVSNRH